MRIRTAGMILILTVAAVVASPAAAAHAATPVLLSDDFEDGDAAGWRSTGGSWSVTTDGTQVLRQASVRGGRVVAGRSDWADYAVTARLKPDEVRGSGWSVGVAARVAANGDHYRLVTRGDGLAAIESVVRGRVTTLATVTYPVYLGTWRSLSLVVKGDTLIGVIGGSQRLRATDTRLRAGRAGLVTTDAVTSIDDVVVGSWAAGPPGTPDTQAPLTPAAPTVVEVTPGFVTITWPATIDNEGVAEYVVWQGDQFYSRYPVRTVAGTGPITLSINPTAATTLLQVQARDAVGNISSLGPTASVTQPPSFPRVPGDTVPPTAPGTASVIGIAADGARILGWEPATDDVGVVEYHVVLGTNIDEVRVIAKVAQPTATVTISGSNPMVRVIAYDASWNAASSALVPLRMGATPTPTPPSS